MNDIELHTKLIESVAELNVSMAQLRGEVRAVPNEILIQMSEMFIQKKDMPSISMVERTISNDLYPLKTDIPIHRSWRLNERHYGALQGFNKREKAKEVGEEQVLIWRRSFDIPPPALTRDDPRWSGNDELYKDVDEKYLPLAESLKDTIERVMPYWESDIVSEIKKGSRILISGHGSGLRAFKTFLDKMLPEEVTKLNIPYAVPLVYEFDDNLNVVKSYYLGNTEKIEKVIKEVERQGKINTE